SLSGEWSGMPGSVFASASTADGWRDHAQRRTGAFGATLGVIDTPARRLELSTLNDWRRYDEPGPLIGRTLFDRAESSPFYRFDEVEERYHRVAIDGRFAAGATSTLVASLTGDYRHSDRVRTVPLAPAFADTKARVLSTARLIGSTQLELDGPLPGDDALMIGADASLGHIESRYHDFMMGSPEVYAAAEASRGDVVASGAGWRNAAAGFLGYTVDITPAVRFTTGARVDWLRDSFDEDDAQEAAEDHSTSHVAFSPRAGLNVQYLDGARQHGRVYFTIARSFKAPTPDQLYDQRTFPVEFPPFQIGFANDQLDPQYASSYEAGVYHHADIVPGALAAELTLSAYHMDIRDEIDFDIASFGYQNIGRSRHRGIEAGLDLRGVRPYSAFVRYALQAVTSRVDGENFGNALKAIPRHFIVAGARAGREDAGPAVSLTATTARRIWLDDANTMRLPDWTRWDARVSWAVAGLTVHADVYNLFDAEYSTTGFPDSADPTTIHYYPAAGRTLYVGVSRSWP
ncbi:MAG: TonB-dependent receptor, partial [Longimicrobiales bacterium]